MSLRALLPVSVPLACRCCSGSVGVFCLRRLASPVPAGFPGVNRPVWVPRLDACLVGRVAVSGCSG